MDASPKELKLGQGRDTVIKIAVWDGVGAKTELSCACLFTHSLHADGLQGGAADLDRALDGALTRLWTKGIPAADSLQTLLMTKLPKSIAASSCLVVGLGKPEFWAARKSADAVAVSVNAAIQHKVASAAFAPSLIDHGVQAGEPVEPHLMEALLNQLEAAGRLADMGLAAPPALKTWYFDAGATHFDGAAVRYQAAFESWKSQRN